MMKAECLKFKEMLPDALDGELTPAGRKEFDRHLAACPSCRREFEAAERALAVFAALPRTEPSPAFVTGVMVKARRARARAARTGRVLSWTTVGATAALSGAFVAGWARYFKPALLSRVSGAVGDAAGAVIDVWQSLRALAAPAAAVGKLAAALTSVGSSFLEEALRASAPVYCGAFVAVAVFYAIWRIGSRAPAAGLSTV
jgi:predicted anti-sigma-YlaC factor YlaD